MPIVVNLHHLERGPVRLEGELDVVELALEPADEVLRIERPFGYALEVTRVSGGILAQGRLAGEVACRCVRCLKAFVRPVDLGAWRCFLPLEGEESVPVENHCVDLTPFAREDIVLALPQHPLCEPECRGLPSAQPSEAADPSGERPESKGVSPWAELNKLKF